jgi:hypothetical protein
MQLLWATSRRLTWAVDKVENIQRKFTKVAAFENAISPPQTMKIGLKK